MCATPIGNLQDITLRALETLKNVNLIAAEDTRHTHKLLNHFAIKTPLTSYHQHNEKSKAAELIAYLKADNDVALVSDAGMPGISDPGEVLVREAILAGIEVDVIPGPSAFTSGLVLSGLPCTPFYFAGFMPTSEKARKDALNKLKDVVATQIFYEAPHRLQKFLQDVLATRGDIELVIARELTKLHQEIIRGRVSAVLQRLAEVPARGELVVFLSAPVTEVPSVPSSWGEEITGLLQAGLEQKAAFKVLAEKYQVPKREIYNAFIKEKDKKTTGC